MNLKVGNNIVVFKEQVVYLEMWGNNNLAYAFRKIWIERQHNRFLLKTDWLGNGVRGISGKASIQDVVKGFDFEFANMVINLFSLSKANLKEVHSLAPNYQLTFLQRSFYFI